MTVASNTRVKPTAAAAGARQDLTGRTEHGQLQRDGAIFSAERGHPAKEPWPGGRFSPRYAAYSEDSEGINPALVGTAFAVLGVFNRMSSVIAGLVIPHVIGSPRATAAGWRVWFICCIVMMAAFIPLCASGLGGYYSPRKARAALLQRSVAAKLGDAGLAGAASQGDEQSRLAR